MGKKKKLDCHGFSLVNNCGYENFMFCFDLPSVSTKATSELLQVVL